MSKSKEKAAARAEATHEAIANVAEATEATAKKAESVVDGVFDSLTAWAAQGLTAAKKGLEASARWLDSRAKVVGELATKLAKSTA